MRKIVLILMSTLFLCSCDCTLSQVPNQFVYADENCVSALIDYRPFVTVKGGCFGYTLSQSPSPGTLLTATNKSYSVSIVATGGNQKKSSISFLVTLLDTITPKITPIGILAQYTFEKTIELYDAGDKIAGILLNEIGDKNDDYYKKLLVNVSMDSAGYRKRFITYLDSLSFPIWEDK